MESDEEHGDDVGSVERDGLLAAEGASILEDALFGGQDSDQSLLERGEIPAAFDGLVLEELIGAGGTGEVYRAHQVGLERDVAVKIRVAKACDAPFADTLISNEARNLAELDHPGIARIHAMGEVEGRRYIVLEHIEGQSLRERIEQPVPLAEALDLMLGIARILAAAHASGLPHRDLKPSNILIASSPADRPVGERVRLIDFGLAGRLFTLKGAGHMGTGRYMAPEQRAGNVAGTAADIYALRRTFEHLVDDDWLHIPSSVRALLRRIGAARPEDRPSAQEIVEVLEKAPGRRRGGSWGWAVGAVVVLALAWLGYTQSTGVDPGRADPEVPSAESSRPSGPFGDIIHQEIEARKERFHAVVSRLRRGDGKTLPITEADLAFLIERAPTLPLSMHGQADRLLSHYGIRLPATRWKGSQWSREGRKGREADPRRED